MHTDDPLDLFLPPVREWFRTALGEPTAPQRQGWPLIASGRNTLILAPTGSGKTLAAFPPRSSLAAGSGAGPRRARPLRLAAQATQRTTIARNLQQPLEGVAETARRIGFDLRRWRPPSARRVVPHRSAEPTPPQRLGWPLIAAGQNTLILAPTGSGKTLAAFLACLDHLWRQEAAPARGVRVLYVSPLKALNNDIHRNLQLPLEGVAETARRMGCDAARPRSRRPHRRHARRRTAAPGPPAAARPHHHAGIAASAADLARPRHAARRHALHRRRDPRPLRRTSAASSWRCLLERLAAIKPTRLRAHRPVGDAAAARRGGALPRRGRVGRRRPAHTAAGRRRGRRAAEGPRPARRQSGRAVRAAAGRVGVAVDLPPARRPDPRASLHHRLRQRPPFGRAHHVVPQRRGRIGPRPPRQRLAGSAAADRGGAEGGPTAGRGGDGVAGAGHRHGGGRSGLPGRVAGQRGPRRCSASAGRGTSSASAARAGSSRRRPAICSNRPCWRGR